MLNNEQKKFFTDKLKEYNENRKKELAKRKKDKENLMMIQAQLMKKCPICGNNGFLKSKKLLSNDAGRIAINVITDKYPKGNECDLHAEICSKCGNVLLYVPLSEIQ